MDFTNALFSGILLLLLASNAAIWHRLGMLEGKLDLHLREHNAGPSR